jgi:hypothetical protein
MFLRSVKRRARLHGRGVRCYIPEREELPEVLELLLGDDDGLLELLLGDDMLLELLLGEGMLLELLLGEDDVLPGL